MTTTTTAKAHRATQIEAIADQIASGYDLRYYDASAEYAQAINDGPDGWTIDVGYGQEDPGWWTRTTGVRLTATELASALRMAETA